MQAENSVRWVVVWVGVRDPRQAKKVEHDRVEWRVVAVCADLSGADTFVAVEGWAKEKRDWRRKYLKLERGIPCPDTFGRVFAARDADEFGAAFLRWVGQGVPALTKGEGVAIDGKTSRRSGKVGATPWHRVSAFAAQPNLAQAIRDRGADSVLAVKDNPPTRAASITDFVSAFEAAPGKTPHPFHEVVEKDQGRLEVRRCPVFDPLDCLHAPNRWPDLKSFARITSERTIRGKTSVERRVYVSRLAPDAPRLNEAVRMHWRVENRWHGGRDVVFGDDPMRARTDHAAQNFAVLRQFVLNLLRLAPVKRQGGLQVQRLIAASSDRLRAELLGLV